MIIDDISLDNVYREEPKNGLHPKCAFCSGDINVLAQDNSWLYFIYKSAIYFTHSECMQNNVSDKEADGFSSWLGTIQNLLSEEQDEV